MTVKPNEKREIFLRASEISDPHQRRRFLDEACDSDEHLRNEIERLLEHDALAESFLETAGPVTNDTRASEGMWAEMPTLAHSPRKDIGATADEQSWTEAAHVHYFGNYELLEEIARGGMGIVYKARQVNLNRIVALKVILSGQLASHDDIRRFRIEAEAAASLQHPNIVAIHEIGEHDGQHFFSMDYVAGKSLAHIIIPQPLPPKTAARYVQIIARAVDYAHRHGVVHRDLKPANILISQNDQPIITDFGLAKQLETDSGLTSTGQIVGTPSYMAPEQASGKPERVGPPVDIYALGAVLYALVTGKAPFQAATAMDTLLQVLEHEPVSPRQLNPVVGRDLETIILKCLAKKPQDRYASAQDVADELARFLNDQPILARPISHHVRIWRWCQRNPVVASLSALLTMLLLALAIGGPWAAAREASLAQQEKTARHIAEQATKDAEAAARAELAARKKAEAERKRAIDESRRAYRNYYVAQMALAQRDWDAADPEHLQQRVEATRPAGTGGIDFRGFEWYHNWQRCDPALLTWTSEPSQPLSSIAWTSTGDRLLFTSQDGTASIWDTRSGRVLQNLRGHRGQVTAGDFSPNGQLVVTAGSDGTVRVWNAHTAAEVSTLNGHKYWVGDATFDGTGELVVSGSGDGTVRVWHWKTGRVVLKLASSGGAVRAVALSPDGKRIAAAGNSVDVWDAQTGDKLLTLKDYNVCSNDVAFSPDGRQLATAGDDHTIRLWDGMTGKELASLADHTKPVYGIAFAPDGKRLASASMDGLVKVWSLASHRVLVTLKGHRRGVTGCSFGPFGRRVATAGNDGTVKIWDASGYLHALTIPLTKTRAARIVFDPSDRILASASAAPDGKITLWSPTTGAPLASWRAHDNYVTAIAFSADGKYLATTGFDRIVKLWDMGTGKELAALSGHKHYVHALQFSPDSRWLFSGSSDHTVNVWDVRALKLRRSLSDHTGPVTTIAVAPAGDLVASGDGTGEVIVWDASSFQQRGRWQAGNERILDLDFDVDGTSLAVAVGQTVSVYQATTGKKLRSLEGHHAAVAAVRYQPGGQRIATAGGDGEVKVWDAVSGDELLTLQAPGGASSVAFSSDGRHLAAACYDATIRIWDARPFDRSLQVDRRAVSLARFAMRAARDEESPVDALLEEDPTVPDDVRARAQQLLREYNELTQRFR